MAREEAVYGVMPALCQAWVQASRERFRPPRTQGSDCHACGEMQAESPKSVLQELQSTRTANGQGAVDAK